MRDKSWLQSREMDSQGPRIITMAIGLWVSNEARVYVIYLKKVLSGGVAPSALLNKFTFFIYILNIKMNS